MRNDKLQIIPTDLLSAYLEQIPKGLQIAFDALKESEISNETFSFYTSVSAMASSKNLNRLGIFYEQLNYAEAMPFLLMLPNAVFNLK